MVRGFLAALVAIVWAVPAMAQQGSPVGTRWPDPPPPQAWPGDPAPPAPAKQPPAKQAPAKQAPAKQAKQPPAAAPGGAAAPAAAAKPAKPAPPPRAVACAGVFAKDSTHLKLAQRFEPKNVEFADVDGPDGSRLKATVLFGQDPKGRLEVLWSDEGSRSGTSLIVITGRSAWIGPKGLKLGLTLPALEKLNGKPFRLMGFGAKENAGQVTGWDGGALAALPGGCKVGLRLALDPKTLPEARAAAAGEAEIASSDPALKAAAPKVAEIIIGY